MKKHVVKISVIFAIVIVVCNMFVLAFLCKNATEIDAKSAVDGMIITNGLTIISLAVTVWLGISIYNSIEKKEFADIKEEFSKAKTEIETCLQVSNEIKAYTRRHYFADSHFDDYIITVETEYGNYQMYDVERSVCDCIQFREEIQPLIYEKIILNHKKMQEEAMVKRMLAYAKAMKFEKKMREDI